MRGAVVAGCPVAVELRIADAEGEQAMRPVDQGVGDRGGGRARLVRLDEDDVGPAEGGAQPGGVERPHP